MLLDAASPAAPWLLPQPAIPMLLLPSLEPPERLLPTPKVFFVELDKCGGFLTQCLLIIFIFFTCASDASKIIFMLALLCTWHTPCFRAAWVNTIHTLTGPRIPLQDGASPPIRTAYDQLRQWGQSFTRSPICPPCLHLSWPSQHFP